MSAAIIPEKLWFCISKRSETQLAYMCPEGTASNINKMKETGRTWARGWGKDAVAGEEVVIDNTPRHGFQIVRSVRRWSTNNVVWRVKDPAGYELEINSGNMEILVQEGTIEKGLVTSMCVWGRHSGKNILIPEGSEEYKSAKERTEEVSVKVSVKDLKPGNTIRLYDGLNYTYLGRSKVTYVELPDVYVKKAKYHILQREKCIEIKSSLHVTSIVDDSTKAYDLLEYCKDKSISHDLKDVSYGAEVFIGDGLSFNVHVGDEPDKMDSVLGVVPKTDGKVVTHNNYWYGEQLRVYPETPRLRFPCKVEPGVNIGIGLIKWEVRPNERSRYGRYGHHNNFELTTRTLKYTLIPSRAAPAST